MGPAHTASRSVVAKRVLWDCMPSQRRLARSEKCLSPCAQRRSMAADGPRPKRIALWRICRTRSERGSIVEIVGEGAIDGGALTLDLAAVTAGAARTRG